MIRKVGLAIPTLVALLSITVLLPSASCGAIAVAYPPDSKNLKILAGEVRTVRVGLLNKSDEQMTVVVEPIGLKNVEVDCPEAMALDGGSSEGVIIGLSPDGETCFSGGIHVVFKAGSNPQGAGGRAIMGTKYL